MLISLRTSLKKRMTKYEDKEQYILATLLDPRFKTKWCRNEEEKSKSEEILLHQAQQIMPLRDVNSTSQVVASLGGLESQLDTQENEPPTKRRKEKSSTLLSYIFNEPRSEANETNSTSLQMEVSAYLSKPCLKEDDDPLQFWRKQHADYPLLLLVISPFQLRQARSKDYSVLAEKSLDLQDAASQTIIFNN